MRNFYGRRLGLYKCEEFKKKFEQFGEDLGGE